MNSERFDTLLNALANIKILVVGDGCLDMYWRADMMQSVLSRETPHFPLPIVDERYSLGAGSNIAADLTSLGCQTTMLTVIGEDWRGHLWTALSQERGINISHTLVDPSRWTPAYGKPIKIGISGEEFEEPRLDFTNRVPLPEPLEEEMCQRLKKLGQETDAVIVSDQWTNGTITPRIREVINNLGDTRPVYVDSRTAISEDINVVLKPNEWEFAEAIGCSFLNIRMMPESEIVQLARKWMGTIRGPLCLTRADRGVMWIDSSQVYMISAPEVAPPVDPVGAGDAFLTAFCACRTAGGEIAEALLFGSLASSIVLRKIGMTGNAKPDEMRQEFRRYNKDSERRSLVHEGIHSV